MRCGISIGKIHLISCDTDSYYFAIAGGSVNHGLECMVRDTHVYKFMLKSNSATDTKKLLGCCIERTGDNMIAPAPKCYSIWNNNEMNNTLKLKGDSLKTNSVDKTDFEDVLKNNTVKTAKSINFQLKNNRMSW